MQTHPWEWCSVFTAMLTLLKKFNFKDLLYFFLQQFLVSSTQHYSWIGLKNRTGTLLWTDGNALIKEWVWTRGVDDVEDSVYLGLWDFQSFLTCNEKISTLQGIFYGELNSRVALRNLLLWCKNWISPPTVRPPVFFPFASTSFYCMCKCLLCPIHPCIIEVSSS